MICNRNSEFYNCFNELQSNYGKRFHSRQCREIFQVMVDYKKQSEHIKRTNTNWEDQLKDYVQGRSQIDFRPNDSGLREGRQDFGKVLCENVWGFSFAQALGATKEPANSLPLAYSMEFMNGVETGRLCRSNEDQLGKTRESRLEATRLEKKIEEIFKQTQLRERSCSFEEKIKKTKNMGQENANQSFLNLKHIARHGKSQSAISGETKKDFR